MFEPSPVRDNGAVMFVVASGFAVALGGNTRGSFEALCVACEAAIGAAFVVGQTIVSRGHDGPGGRDGSRKGKHRQRSRGRQEHYLQQFHGDLVHQFSLLRWELMQAKSIIKNFMMCSALAMSQANKFHRHKTRARNIVSGPSPLCSSRFDAADQ